MYFYNEFRLINPYRSHTPKGYYDKVKGHTGADYATPSWTPISLPFQVKVLDYKKQAQMGNTLYVQDNAGNVLVFAHLNSLAVEVGGKIPPDTILAHTGNTGSATTGPHLHVEIISSKPDLEDDEGKLMTRSLGGYTGYNIDPVKYFNQSSHWSDEDMEWALEHGLITERKDPSQMVSWGEQVVFSRRLAKKLLEWTRNE